MARKPARTYLDNAASTPVDKRVLSAMRPYFDTIYANPGGIHREGVEAEKAVAEARHRIASLLQATDDSVIFTGSGTEANNLALVGFIEALHEKGKRYSDMEVIVGAIEHPSVLEPARFLESRGVRVIRIGVSPEGLFDPQEIARALTKKTVFVSIGYVNSEIGTIAPIREIAKRIRSFRHEHDTPYPSFHTDACQAAAYLPLHVPLLGVDLLTLDAQKIHGPKGVGLLMKRRGISLAPLIRGGGQEGGYRSGTENVPGIVGFAKALALAEEGKDRRARRVAEVRDYGLREFARQVPGSFLNGSHKFRVANNINVTVPGLDGELMVLALDAEGIAASTKSACERESGPSHVLRALGLSARDASSSLRLTISPRTTRATLSHVARVIAGLRVRQQKFDR